MSLGRGAAVVDVANAAGVQKGAGWDLNNRIALGSAEASPLDQATGYATIANMGVHVPSHVVREVRDLRGQVLYQAKPATNRAFSEDVARDTTYALQNVVNEGTGAKVSSLGRDIAGKTGTAGVNDDVVSSWFVAYTTKVSTAVMYVAGDAGNADLDPYARRGDATFFGGTYPALTWLDYMKVATGNYPNEKFRGPVYVNGKNAPPDDPSPQARPSSASSSSVPATPSAPAPSASDGPQPSASASGPSQSSRPSRTRGRPSIEPPTASLPEPSTS
ncbi:MAG: penicillin-binding transpeptidase domain-containing protein [Actinomycetia bacterium]|nr:penicillin-binding transpeptidase domain-containing protein [Actinomycetes bacterium]